MFCPAPNRLSPVDHRRQVCVLKVDPLRETCIGRKVCDGTSVVSVLVPLLRAQLAGGPVMSPVL